MSKGWHNNPQGHSLASRGIKAKSQVKQKPKHDSNKIVDPNKIHKDQSKFTKFGFEFKKGEGKSPPNKKSKKIKQLTVEETSDE